MKRSSKLLLAAMCVSSAALFADEPKTKGITPLSGYVSVKGDPLQARIYTLPNGLTVYLSVYKNAPRIQTYIAVRAGSKNDPSHATGLAHYLEHMVFKGTDKFGTRDFEKENAEIAKLEGLFEVYRQTKDEKQRKALYRQIDSVSGVAAKYAIANEYDKMLAVIGADGTNAYTSFDQTVYVNDIPSNQIANWLTIEAERFRRPVLRLFHTELEAVYEEKNRGLDNDNNKIWEAMFAGLFNRHTYGTQTTIGTIEHLKNPSMQEIRKYYDHYYVPNNMAIVMSGDFNPDSVITLISRHFGTFGQKTVNSFTFQPEPEMTAKVVKEITGPDPESVSMGWRLPGDGTKEADLCMLVSSMLYNGTAGLIDLNLNQAQKVLSGNCFFYPLRDYAFFGMSGDPKEGQKLEEVESHLISQLELLKKGEFPDWLIGAVVTDLKLRKTKELENNASRADMMLSAFVNGLTWQHAVEQIDRLSKFTKQDVTEFAKKYFTDRNYVVVYKRTGEDRNVVKVTKPQITPVEVDREHESPFVKEIAARVPPPVEPRFLDYSKDLQTRKLNGGAQLLYNANQENKLFELYYKFEMGSNAGKLLPVAIRYVPYLATQGMSAAAVKQELYKLGCSFNVFSDPENTWVSLSGLDENFEKSLALFEKVLRNPVVDEQTLKNLVGDIIKERADNKLQKRLILNRAMTSYARYGALNPFTNVLTNEELLAVTAAQVKKAIEELLTYQHRVLYYGPRTVDQVTGMLATHHKSNGALKAVPDALKFEEKNLDRQVLVVDYDMKQAEIVMLSNGGAFDKTQVPVITLYNSYFGAGMSSVLFQELREARALAYSTYSRYNQPNKLYKKYYNLSYIGSQADKLGEALSGLNEMLNSMPKSATAFQAAKESVLQEMRTQRVTRGDVLFNYLQAQDLNLNNDIRRDIFEKVQSYKFDDVVAFHEQQIRNKPLTVLVLGKKDLLDLKVLEKYGTVKFLDLKEVFGY
jgi:predicted Zn-dependent peptidase